MSPNGSDYSERLAPRPRTGRGGGAPKQRMVSRKKSRHSAKEWQFMGAMASRVRDAVKRFCGFATPTKRRTTAHAARRAGKFWPIEVCLGYWDQTGRELWKNWKP